MSKQGLDFINILHMHFVPIFWCQKLQSCVLGLTLLGAKISAKKVHIRCWWNWHKNGFKPFSCLQLMCFERVQTNYCLYFKIIICNYNYNCNCNLSYHHSVETNADKAVLMPLNSSLDAILSNTICVCNYMNLQGWSKYKTIMYNNLYNTIWITYNKMLSNLMKHWLIIVW